MDDCRHEDRNRSRARTALSRGLAERFRRAHGRGSVQSKIVRQRNGESSSEQSGPGSRQRRVFARNGCGAHVPRRPGHDHLRRDERSAAHDYRARVAGEVVAQPRSQGAACCAPTTDKTRESGLTTGSEAKKKRVLSGMRPTGKLHIGHYFGALQNWVRLQNDPTYDCFYFIADWHALTSDYADTSAIAENTLQIMIDYLAAGLDPAKSVIFQQSVIPEHAELHLLLSMVTPLGWLERVPTYKEALENVRSKDLHTYGFLGYPTLQTADIVIYGDLGGSLVVPVGEDQVSHVEFSRELVRRFNTLFGLDWQEGVDT